MSDERTLNELHDQIQEIIAEHGFITGQELLDLTDNDIPLQHVYAAYWDAIVFPDLADKIQRQIDKLS